MGQRHSREREGDSSGGKEFDELEVLRHKRLEEAFSNPEGAQSTEKCYDPEDHTLDFVEGDDDMDFLSKDFVSKRARMTCGHTVTPPSLTEWCQQQLDEGATGFICGKCDKVWSYGEVCKMALLTPEEKKSFEDMLFANAAKYKLRAKACPGCQCRIVRADPDNLCVKCPRCSALHGKSYEFCWQCLKKWKGPVQASERCENPNCDNEQLQTLTNCPDIEFEEGGLNEVKGCPSIRGCPKCGKLLEHSQKNCKFITCKRCKMKFCFICLQSPKKCNNDYYGSCVRGVAPRQTRLPVWE